MYKFGKFARKPEFSDQFSNLVICYKQKGYNIDIIKQSAWLAVNPIIVDHFAHLFNCTPVDWSGFRLYDGSDTLDGLGRNFICLVLGSPGLNWWFSVFQ